VKAAWAAAALSFACVVASVALWVADGEDVRHLVGDASHLNAVLIVLTFSAVGALIVFRRPGHRVGWIFCIAGLLSAVTELATSYAVHADRSRPPLPARDLAASVGDVGWVPALGAIVFLLLLFPDGRPLTGRWWLAVRLAGLGIVVTTVALVLHPHELLPEERLRIENPYAVPAARHVLDAMVAIGAVLTLGAMVAGVVSLVLRWRRSSGAERLQLKWFTYAAAVLAVAALATNDLGDSVPIGAVRAALIGPVLAVATGVAILRHRLYDIDVVINRTLVYGALTITLGAVYLGLVLLLGLAVGRSNLSIAVSTLAVAALFRPARARIQAAVDRRFYRRRYDAALTLQRFVGRLRDELDLDAVQGELVGVVQQTVQPEHVTLWLPRNDSRTHGP
jgi:hypothetical protein